MPDLFVTVHRTGDAIEGEIVRDLLVEEGLDARLLGGRVDAAVWGAAARVESRVDVRAEQADKARRIVELHLGEIRPAPAEEEELEEPGERVLRPIVCAGVVAVCPGAGHFYARRPVVGAVILFGQLAMLATMIAAGPRLGSSAAVFACGLFLFDLVGGQVAVRAWNRGARPTGLRQLVHATLVLVGLGAVAAACGPMVERLQLPQRKGGRQPVQEIRAGSKDPRQLPFPLHLDFGR